MPKLLAAYGSGVEIYFAPTALLLERIRAGEAADGVILTRTGLDGLAASGLVAASSIVDIAWSRVGLAVPYGAPRPDISTETALKAALLSGRIAYSRAGASGIAFAALIERMGIAEAVNASARIVPAGFTAEALLRGEADLAVQQVSELMAVPGVDVIGAFPASVDTPGLFSAAPLTAAQADPSPFLRFLGSAAAAPILEGAGLTPAGP